MMPKFPAGDKVQVTSATPMSGLNAGSAATATSIAAELSTDAPAGGTGATAGAYDTSANRDLAIATINALNAWAGEMDIDFEALLIDVADIRTKLNLILAALKTNLV